MLELSCVEGNSNLLIRVSAENSNRQCFSLIRIYAYSLTEPYCWIVFVDAKLLICLLLVPEYHSTEWFDVIGFSAAGIRLSNGTMRLSYFTTVR